MKKFDIPDFIPEFHEVGFNIIFNQEGIEEEEIEEGDEWKNDDRIPVWGDGFIQAIEHPEIKIRFECMKDIPEALQEALEKVKKKINKED